LNLFLYLTFLNKHALRTALIYYYLFLDNYLVEVDNLIKRGVDPNLLIRYGLEYKFITLFLLKEIDYNTLFKQLNTAIHQFSKRQMTWFRKMERDGFKINWIDISLDEEEKLRLIMDFLRSHNS
jgi:tRNA dimethylallyltransferase